MRELVPACPPGAVLSSTSTSSPSDARVDRGRQPGRPGADDDDVAHRRRVERRR